MAIDMRELGLLRPATGCTSKWSKMDGDGTVRRCRACQQNVYRFGDLDPFAARELLLREEGKLCVRFYARKDGTALTRDCMVGVRRRKMKRVAVSLLLVVLFGALAFVVEAGGPMRAGRLVVELFELSNINLAAHAAPPHDPTNCTCMLNFASNNAY